MMATERGRTRGSRGAMAGRLQGWAPRASPASEGFRRHAPDPRAGVARPRPPRRLARRSRRRRSPPPAAPPRPPRPARAPHPHETAEHRAGAGMRGVLQHAIMLDDGAGVDDRQPADARLRPDRRARHQLRAGLVTALGETMAEGSSPPAAPRPPRGRRRQARPCRVVTDRDGRGGAGEAPDVRQRAHLRHAQHRPTRRVVQHASSSAPIARSASITGLAWPPAPRTTTRIENPARSADGRKSPLHPQGREGWVRGACHAIDANHRRRIPLTQPSLPYKRGERARSAFLSRRSGARRDHGAGATAAKAVQACSAAAARGQADDPGAVERLAALPHGLTAVRAPGVHGAPRAWLAATRARFSEAKAPTCTPQFPPPAGAAAGAGAAEAGRPGSFGRQRKPPRVSGRLEASAAGAGRGRGEGDGPLRGCRDRPRSPPALRSPRHLEGPGRRRAGADVGSIRRAKSPGSRSGPWHARRPRRAASAAARRLLGSRCRRSGSAPAGDGGGAAAATCSPAELAALLAQRHHRRRHPGRGPGGMFSRSRRRHRPRAGARRVGLGPSDLRADARDVVARLVRQAATAPEIILEPGFLAAYNAGPRRLEDYLWGNRGLPNETRNYVARIGPRIEGTARPPRPAGGLRRRRDPARHPARPAPRRRGDDAGAARAAPPGRSGHPGGATAGRPGHPHGADPGRQHLCPAAGRAAAHAARRGRRRRRHGPDREPGDFERRMEPIVSPGDNAGSAPVQLGAVTRMEPVVSPGDPDDPQRAACLARGASGAGAAGLQPAAERGGFSLIPQAQAGTLPRAPTPAAAPPGAGTGACRSAPSPPRTWRATPPARRAGGSARPGPARWWSACRRAARPSTARGSSAFPRAAPPTRPATACAAAAPA